MKAEIIEAVFSQVPLLADFTPDDFIITPLKGYTNANFHLHNDRYDWVLRVPRAKTNSFIERAAEAHNQALAEQLKIAPRVTWRNDDGITLTPTLKASRELRPADFTNVAMLATIIEPIRRLHRSGLGFHGRVNLQELLSAYYAMLGEGDRQRLAPRMRQAERVLESLPSRDEVYVASHNDLVLENMMLDQTRLWLIDWEYSAMASPYWDLATLCNCANLDDQQSRRLLRIYCAGERVMEESTLGDYRYLLNLLSDCWMAALAD